MNGGPGAGRHVQRRWWRLLLSKPTTWRQAVVQAFTTGLVLVVVGYWVGMLPQDPRMLLWWLPLWMAFSMVGYALGRGRRRSELTYREPYPPG